MRVLVSPLRADIPCSSWHVLTTRTALSSGFGGRTRILSHLPLIREPVPLSPADVVHAEEAALPTVPGDWLRGWSMSFPSTVTRPPDLDKSCKFLMRKLGNRGTKPHAIIRGPSKG